MKFLFVLITLCCGASGVLAQTVADLDPVTITANRLAQPSSATARSITIIDSATIAALPVFSVDDLLKYFGNVEMQQRGPGGAQADVVLRGGTFQQVLVLLDGVKVNDPVTGHFSAYIPITPGQIKRIEILKGPAAAMYGSEAVGGVIHIISKGFGQQIKKESTSGSAQLAAGEYGLLHAAANVLVQKNKTVFSAAILSNYANGQLTRGPERGYFYNQTASVAVAHQLAKNWLLSLHSSYDVRDFAAQNYYTTFVSDTATEKVNTWWNHAQLKQNVKKGTAVLDVLFKATTDNYVYNPAAVANHNVGKLWLAQFTLQKKYSQNLAANYGLYGEIKSIVSNDRGNHSNKQAAGFATVLYTAGNFVISPAARVIHDQNFGWQVLPQLNVRFKKDVFVLRGVAGRAIRSADFTERYNNYNKPLVTGGSVGNPALTAEKSWSYEVGADVYAGAFKISATAFLRRQNDVIDFVPTPYANMPRQINLSPSGTFALAKNLKKVQTKGLEFELVYRKQLGNHNQIMYQGGLILLNSKSSDSIPSFYIISHAKTLLQQVISIQSKIFTLSFSSVYKERMPRQAAAIKANITAQYWLFNTKLSAGLGRYNVFLMINNLGNITYADLLGARMPGRRLSAGVNVQLGAK